MAELARHLSDNRRVVTAKDPSDSTSAPAKTGRKGRKAERKSRVTEPIVDPTATLVPSEVSTEHTVLVRRSPRYFRFIAVGVVVGLIVTVILTFSFPEQADFNNAQVFGFVGLIAVVTGAALGSIVAIVVDRIVGRKPREAVMVTTERFLVDESAEAEAAAETEAEAEASAPDPGASVDSGAAVDYSGAANPEPTAGESTERSGRTD